MNKYLLFIYGNYYPSGGANDFYGSFHSIETAISYLQNIEGEDHAHIFNIETSNIIMRFKNYRPYNDLSDWREEPLDD